MRAGAIVQARMGSTRLPGKVLADLGGVPLLGRVIERLQAAKCLQWIGVATTTAPEDRAIADFCAAQQVPCFRGPVDDVLARTLLASQAWSVDPIVRITADAPFVCPNAIDELVAALSEGADYATYSEPTVHEGIDPFRRAYLVRLAQTVHTPDEREHLALLVRNHPGESHVVYVDPDPAVRERPGLRLSVDEPADLEFARAAYEALGDDRSVRSLLDLLDRRPELAKINGDVSRSVPRGVL